MKRVSTGAAKPAAVKPKTVAKPSPVSAACDAVAAFMGTLDHPLKTEFEILRKMIGAVNVEITEEIKWNSLGFRTTDSFATVNLRSREAVQLIFHLGAKVRKPLPELKITDPEGLMKWIAKDRCLVTLGAGKVFAGRKPALQMIVRQWLVYV